jgi:thiol-disulfide isomerase/thioredoxin
MNAKNLSNSSVVKAAFAAGVIIAAFASGCAPAEAESVTKSPGAVSESGAELRLKPAVEYLMGQFPQSVALADLNGNGRLDVATSNRRDNSVTVRLGGGDGTFGEAVTYRTDPEPLFVRAADLNGDGILDLVTANFSNTLTILLGQGDGKFLEATSFSAGDGDLMPLNVVVADFNGDTVPDLAVANFLGNTVGIFYGQGDGLFAEPTHISVGDGPISIVAADFNRNGHADLAVANRRGDTATILLGNGRGEFTETSYEIGARAGFIAADDLTGDGVIDLAIASYMDNSITLLLGDGEGAFTRADVDVGMCHPSSLALADMNGNGAVDIVTVCQSLSSVAVLLNGGGGDFPTPATAFRVGMGPDAVAVGDLNEDGLPDIVTANLGGGSISVLLSGEGDPGRPILARFDESEIPAKGDLTLVVEFETPEDASAAFSEVNVYVLNMARPSLQEALKFKSREKSFQTRFEDLPRGRYLVFAFTGPWERRSDATRPGAFLSQEGVFLDGHTDETIHRVRYVPFDAAAMKGTAVGKGRVLDVEGAPVRGLELRAVVRSQTAGELEIATVQTDEEGRFEFTNLAQGVSYEITDDQQDRLGSLSSGADVTLTVAPRVGQTAPDIEFIHLASGETRKLSDFRGKVLLIDFWATWCGPCQEPMAKMQNYRDANPDWGDKVELIALSIDDTRRAVELHLEKNGWNKSYNAWAGAGGFRAAPPQAFRITGVPTAYVIDSEGKVAATGHPMAMNIPGTINRLLAGESVK